MQRQNPRNLDAEISVVGGLLFRGRAFDQVSSIVAAEDFYDPRHEVIYEAIVSVAATGHPVDLLTVAAELRRTGGMARLEASGATAYLADLANQVSSTEGISKHAHMVKEKSFLRRLIVETGRIQDRAYNDQEPAEAIIESAQANILGLAALSPRKEPKHISKILHGNIVELDRRMSSPGAIGGVPSGIEELDEITGGAQAGHLDVLAGRPGMGKTALVMSWVMHAVTLPQPHPCLVFSIEMPEEELGMRALSGAGQVDNSLMRSGLLTSLDWSRLVKAAEWLSPAPLWIDDDGAQDLFSICSKARQWRRNTKAFPTGQEKGMIVVDYLQLIAASRKKGQYSNREREVAETSAALKALAKQLNLPVLALSSLNRKCEDRPDKRPQMADLKESGAIESDADVVMLLYRDEVYNKDPAAKSPTAKPNAGIAEICVAKHRGGPTGTIECQYQKEFTLFRRLAKRDGWTPSNY